MEAAHSAGWQLALTHCQGWQRGWLAPASLPAGEVAAWSPRWTQVKWPRWRAMLSEWELQLEEEKGSARLLTSAGETLWVLQWLGENLTVLPGHPASPLLQSTQPEVCGSNPTPRRIAAGSQQSQSPQHAHTPPSRVQAAGRGPKHPVCRQHRHGTEMGWEPGLRRAGSEGRRAQAGRGPRGEKGATGHREEGDAPQP